MFITSIVIRQIRELHKLAHQKMALLPLSTVASVFLAAVSASTAIGAEKEFFRIGTGSVKGVYLPIANRLCQRINASADLHGYRCGVAATSGSGTNIQQIRDGDIQFAFAQSDFTILARDESSYNGIATVFTLHVEPIHVVVRDDGSVADLNDLKEKTVNVGEQGSGSINVSNSVLRAIGLNAGDYDVTHYGPSIQSEMLCGGQTDVVFWVAGVGNLSVSEAFFACDVKLLSLSKRVIGKLLSEAVGFEATNIPADTYVGQTEDIMSVGPRAKLITAKTTEEKLVSLVASAIVDEFGNIRNIHPSLVGLQPTSLALGAKSEVWHPAALEHLDKIIDD